MIREWELWRSFWGSCGAQGDPKLVFEDLDRRYREPHRFYHTWAHVRVCLEELVSARPLCRDQFAVELALWCHDAVYDPRAKDNERRSATIARAAAVGMGLGEATAAEAEALVLATTHGENAGKDKDWEADARIVLDVDLAILGKSPREFSAYEAGIRAEYTFLPDEDYRKGRRRVLESFLRRPLIYRTELFRERYERRARVNIQESLERLAARAISPTSRPASRRPAKRRG
jgi:predicted metal-dependent HD superfamily phosphohydrolase